MKIFMIGAGNAARVVLKELAKEATELYAYDHDPAQIETLQQDFPKLKSASLDQIPDVDYVIECASGAAVKQAYKEVLKQPTTFIVLSSGAFADEAFRDDFQAQLASSKAKVVVPSGAIAGLDLITAIASYVEEITITTTKSPKSLGMSEINDPVTVFSGSAGEAIKKYPKNINVAVTLSLAVQDFSKVKVQIVADPKATSNAHHIQVNATTGTYGFQIQNNTSNNPGTSLLAPLSIIGVVRGTKTNFKIGM